MGIYSKKFKIWKDTFTNYLDEVIEKGIDEDSLFEDMKISFMSDIKKAIDRDELPSNFFDVEFNREKQLDLGLFKPYDLEEEVMGYIGLTKVIIEYLSGLKENFTMKKIREAREETSNFENDFDDIMKDAGNRKYAWDYFDYHSEEISAEDVVSYIQAGNFDEVFEMNVDYALEIGWDGAKTLITEAGYDFNDVNEAYSDLVSQIAMEVEGNSNFNVGSIMPNELFFYDTEEIEIPDMYSLYEDDESADILVQEAQDFIKLASKFGFSEKDAMEVIENSTYGGMGGVGVIASGGDVAEAILNGKPSIGGNVILYCRDSVNGSGYYQLGSKWKDITYKNFKQMANSMDEGSYSLGDVFGTSDWTWR